MKKSKKTTRPAELLMATFANRGKAEAIVNVLHSLGYREEEIMLLMSDHVRQQHFPGERGDVRQSPAQTKAEDEYRGHKVIEGTGVGSTIGGTVGAIVGAITAIGSTLVVPGLGLLVAGPVAGALAGAGAGGIGGGIIGSLVGAGVPEEKASHYHQVMQEGGIILGVHPHNKEDAAFIRNKLDAMEAPAQSVTREDIALRAYTMYQAGSEDAEANWYQAEKDLLEQQGERPDNDN